MNALGNGYPFPPERDDQKAARLYPYRPQQEQQNAIGPPWISADEIAFIRSLAEREDQTTFEGYVKSLPLRQQWGRIAPDKVYAEIARLRRPNAEADR